MFGGFIDGNHGYGFVFGGVEGHAMGLDDLDAEAAHHLIELIPNHANAVSQRLIGAVLRRREGTVEVVENGKELGDELGLQLFALAFGLASKAVLAGLQLGQGIMHAWVRSLTGGGRRDGRSGGRSRQNVRPKGGGGVQRIRDGLAANQHFPVAAGRFRLGIRRVLWLGSSA
jgi:hypothetical protein